MTALTLDALRRDLEEYGAALAEEDYLNAVGVQDDVDSQGIHARFAHLHSRDALRVVRRALEGADATDARRLRRLEMDILGGIVEAAFAEEEDRLVTESTRETVTVDGVTVRWREVGDRIRNEDDRDARRRWVRADHAVARKYLPREEDLEERARAFIARLGYADAATRWEHAFGIPLADLDARMQRVLADTETLYTRALREWLAQTEGLDGGLVDVPLPDGGTATVLEDVEGHDVAHAMRAKRFDAALPQDRLLPAWRDFVQGLGLDPGKLPNVKLDLEDRPAKTDRAFVLAAHVPRDVRLVTKPAGGVDDWRALFHETAHALHYALTDAALPYEDRYLGEGGLTESYAFLFEHLLENPRFLDDVAPDLDDALRREYLHHCGLDKLMGLRDYAAALGYDRWAATAPLSAQPARYVAAMTDAMKWPAHALHYLDTDGFDGAWYLRAWMLEAAHRAFLEKTFGKDWWRHPDAGAHLTRLFRRGEAIACEDVAREIGAPGLDVAPVIADARRLLDAAL